MLARVFDQDVDDPSSTKKGSRRLVSGLVVDLELFVGIRSQKTYSSDTIGKIVETAFDTEAERRGFYKALIDPSFDSVNYMDITINDRIIQIRPSKDSVYGTAIGVGVGLGSAAALGLLGGALLFRRRRQRSMRGASLGTDQPASHGNGDGEYFYPDQPMRT